MILTQRAVLAGSNCDSQWWQPIRGIVYPRVLDRARQLLFVIDMQAVATQHISKSEIYTIVHCVGDVIMPARSLFLTCSLSNVSWGRSP
jgi:hypothetical protein